MRRLVCLVAILCGLFATVTAIPYYTVIAPKVVRPNSEYHVAVSTAGISTPTEVSVQLEGALDNGGVFKAETTKVVEPYQTRIFLLQITDTTSGRYVLTATGNSGLIFQNSTNVTYVHKSYSVFIQTDRAIYKPGSKVQFRCVVLDSRMRPVNNRLELDVYMTDGSGNRIKQWNKAPIERGVFKEELDLSASPVLGDWKIVANVVDQTFEKQFQVAEYVLPKFEVSIDAPEHTTFQDGMIPVTIDAKYTYGKPVKGEATITAYANYFSTVLQPIFQKPVRKVVPIDGNVTVEFNIRDDLRLSEDYERSIQLEVAVEEALTGRRQNVSMQLTIHRHKFTMDLIKSAEYYKPGLKYTAFLKLTKHDGSPVQDTKNPVVISYGYTSDETHYTNITRILDEHGMIQLDFYPPVRSNDDRGMALPLNIEATYMSLHEWFPATYQAISLSNTFIQAMLKTETPVVNKDVEIEVNSTSPLKYLSYEVLGRGDILTFGTVQVYGKTTASFRFLATYVMAPIAHVLIYYARDDGEIVADSLEIELHGTLQNFVDINVTPGEVAPGESVEIKLSAKPHSYIGLLGIDQRSLLLKSGNDITYDQVVEELRSYDMSENSIYSDFDDEPMFGRPMFARRAFSHPGSAAAHDVFKKSGTVILTNGYVHMSIPPEFYRGNFDGVAFASAAAAGSAGPPEIATETPKVRKKFPETWLWQALDAGETGVTSIRRNVPDSITSWVLSAFSVDGVYGLGLMEMPRKLKVFKPFFVSVDLPYSVIRGEIVAVSITVFNYMDRETNAEVVLEHQGALEFAEMSNQVDSPPKLELFRKKSVRVPANNGASVSFMITPRELGYIGFIVRATSPIAGDSVEHKLLVKAEGETQYRNKAVFLDLKTASNLKTNITIDIPKNIVPGSEHIEISAVGDILGPSIPNLANLIKMPFGCGEQNMLNMVPNIVILNYLRNTNQLTQAVQSKALRYLEIGYQQELTYRHTDGSFSAFGMSDPSGSTWLTGFVAKSFKQAAEHITVEDRIIDEALQWLSNNQAPNGSFPEVGKVSHTDMQGGAAKGLALTAYTLTAFLENENATEKYRNVINKGVAYIVRNMEGIDDLYALSLCTYVLNLDRHRYEEIAFKMLESKATTKEDLKWWSKPIPKDDKNPWYGLPRSVDVEMTSYAMLTYLQRNRVADAIPIMKWLVKQRNQEGGFSSTQDTVVGIYALSKLGELMRSKNNNIAITILYEGGGRINMNINSANAMILQKNPLPRKVRLVNITATGSGFALIQVSTHYNLNVTGAWPLFTLDPQVDKNSNENHLQLSICSGFVATREANESNMAVMEVSLPSGFTVDMDSLPSLEVSQNVKRVETKNGDTMVVLYFDKMTRQEYCPTVSAFRTHKVALQKPVPVSIYDYYDSSRRARVFYEPKATRLCDLCEDEECKRSCDGFTNEFNDTGASASRAASCTYIIIGYFVIRRLFL